MTDDLASGFQSVDRASDFALFSSCLTLIDSLPFFADCKRESYELLGAVPGRRILEVGCGLGDDAASLAKFVAPGGSVVAIDGSQTMIETARERHGDVAGLSFDVWCCASSMRRIGSIASFRQPTSSRRMGLSAATTLIVGQTSCEPPMRKGDSAPRTPGSWCPGLALKATTKDSLVSGNRVPGGAYPTV